MTAALLQLWFDAEHSREHSRENTHGHVREHACGHALADERADAPRRAEARRLAQVAAAEAATAQTDPSAVPDRAEFEAIYRERFEALCDYAHTFLGTREEARDVVQDVFVRLWQRREEIWAQGNPVGYLVAATRNGAISALRHRAVEGRYADDPQHQIAPANEPLVVFDPKLEQVYDFIDALPPRAREVLTLRWRHGLSMEQIAAAMGIGVASARVTHARGIAMLRERFGLK